VAEEKELMMTKKMTGMLAMLAVGAFAFSVSAFCPDEKTQTAGEGKAPCGSHAKIVADGEKKAPCGSHATTVADGEKAPCAKAAGEPCPCPHSKAKAVTLASDNERVNGVMAALPKVQYKVGDQVMCCSKTAAMIAEKDHKTVQYVVGEETFEKEGDAEAKLASVLEAKLAEMQAVQYAVGGDCVKCPVTAKSLAKEKKAEVAYRVAGIDFQDQEKAEKAAGQVTEALQAVKISYKVDGQSFCCDKMAGMKVKETGKPMLYVVGEEETPCDQHAKLLLAHAKIQAAVVAAALLAS
jgi:uncharacterized Zn-binding protein involved in type VI secretion/bacterioferritin-associated ferredoxin